MITLQLLTRNLIEETQNKSCYLKKVSVIKKARRITEGLLLKCVTANKPLETTGENTECLGAVL